MALHPSLPRSPCEPLDPAHRWLPADEARCRRWWRASAPRYTPAPRPSRYRVAVKVIDIFGNDTMTIVPVTVG